ncbi:SbcC/MukB-like Walker B domain-containing protein [Microbulbifer sp. SAOS-129_SWC]|uniref:ATP-binding protein n=1 Tax=Microbulbifer sp. SAOS-129_SWC TaxID=3145235 RepID=UPI003217E2C0
MFLKKLILINWGNIPQLEYDFGPINLFSGGNGSGKTTAADAIQTLMTAAHDTLFTFNPGQDETTQRGRGGKQVRTLASYVLGCDDGSYARLQPTDCYIAGVFHPTSGEDSEPFTAVMAIRAHLDTSSKPAQARQSDLRFFLFPGEQLAIGDFIREYKDGKHLLPLDKFNAVLGKQFAKVEQYDKKKAYLRRLYGALRGRRDAVPDREAMHAARTFSNFMAYKPVKSINDFVAQEVLEKRDLGDAIRSVSELMKTIHSMEQEARQIVDRVASLEQIAQNADLYRDQWLQLRVQEYQRARHRQLRVQKSYLAGKNSQQQLHANLESNTRETRIAAERAEQLNQELVELQAQRLGIDALRSKDQLEQRIAAAHRQLSEQGSPLAAQEQRWQQNRESAGELLNLLQGTAAELEIPALRNKSLVQCIKQVAKEDDLPDLHKLLGKDWIDLAALAPLRERAAASEALHNRLGGLLAGADDSESSLREQIEQQASRWQLKVQQLQKQLHAQESRIQHLQANRVRYPQSVEQALAAIREQCPAAEPRVLCDYVEVLDERWQMAVEGYLGGARFSIIVEPEHEAAAIRIVRNLPGRNNRARVIQGDKARRDAERAALPQGSIVELMDFNHKTAEYYLRASYGSVQQVRDENELRGTRRGLTADGLASGNYSMWRCDIDDAELVFGQGARARALAAQQRALEQLLAEAGQVNEQHQLYRRVAGAVRSLSGLQLVPVVDAALAAQREWRSAEQALENLDLGDSEQLEQQVAELKVQLQAQQKLQGSLQNDAGKLERDLENTARQLKALSAELDSLDEALEDSEAAVRRIGQIAPDYDAEQILEQADAQVESAADSFDFGADLEEMQGRLEKFCRQLDRAVMDYNGTLAAGAAAGDTLVFEPDLSSGHSEALFKLVCNLHSQVEALRNRLKNNLLVDRHEQLLGLKKSFNTTFVTHLCHAIYQSINDGKRVLDDLNKELEHHRFGADRERFRFAYTWVPEFRDYWNFFKAVIELPNLGEEESLFDAQLNPAQQKVRDRLLDMLLSEDEQVARRELDRISDYRNYRSYEIFKEPEGKEPIALSQYGTGSGGQLETPAYIIRSAAVTSAFRFNEGSSHLQMVLVDEAFSKMDETRSREVIRYLTETLGLQLVFIMPSSKSGPFMDLISNQFVFSKCPSSKPVGQLNTRVYVDRKVCNKERIAELWANHRRTIRQQASLDFMEMVEA